MYYLILLFSGIMTALPLVIPQLCLLSWVSMIPLFYITLMKKSGVRKHPYLYGLVWSMGFYGVLYYWFVCLYPLDFAGLDNIQSVMAIITAWVGMSIMQGVGTAFVPVIIYHLSKNKINVLTPFIMAAAWTISEWVQTLGWTGVPWGRLAISQYKLLPMIQSASLFGSLFVGFLIALVNGFITVAILKRKSFNLRSAYAITAAAIVVVNFGFGTINLALYKNDSNPVKVALIQGNISSNEKWREDSLEYSVNTYVELIRQAKKDYSPDIIVLPETVIPTPIRYSDYAYSMAEASLESQAVILVGTYDSVFNDEKEDYDMYNSIIAFYPNGTVSHKPYYKRHLVPFGEYLPMEKIIKMFLPVLAELNVFNNPLIQGTDTALSNTKFGKIGSLICFDSIYETLTLDSVRDGAGLLAISTNDSWYKDSAAVYQHNAHAILRSVESGRYVARAANTGISSFIKPTGEVLDYLKPLTKGNLYGQVSFNTHTTLYTIVGNLIVYLSFMFLAAMFVLQIGEKIITRRSKLYTHQSSAE